MECSRYPRGQAALIQRHIFVTGRVQGVGFRASTARMARQYPKVKGFVRNLEDGRVEAVFSGPDADVLALVSWCRKGPILAKVTELEVIEEEPTVGFLDFDVRI